MWAREGTANEYWVAFGDDKNILELVMMMV